MKILVTGASGYIGKHIIPILLEKGHDIVATSTNPEKILTEVWFSKVRYVATDLYLNDINYYEKFFRPEALIHLAWSGLPNYNDLFHIEKNLLENYSFIKKMIKSGVNDVTVLGTCLEYGKKNGKLSEDLCTHPTCSYGISKDTLLKFLELYRHKNEFILKWIRLFYVYGHDQANTLIGQLESAVKKGQTDFDMSPGDQVRDYLKIDTAADYIVSIALQTNISGVINCCSSNPIRIRDFVNNYISSHNYSIIPNFGKYQYNDYEPMNFYGDNSKLLRILQKDQYYE